MAHFVFGRSTPALADAIGGNRDQTRSGSADRQQKYKDEIANRHVRCCARSSDDVADHETEQGSADEPCGE